MGRTRREIKKYARKLRRNQTASERRLWYLIFFAFFPQRITPINYVADYYNPLSRVIVEVDGGVHDGRKAFDKERDRRHRLKGILTVRVSNNLALNHRLFATAKILIYTFVWQFFRWFH